MYTLCKLVFAKQWGTMKSKTPLLCLQEIAILMVYLGIVKEGCAMAPAKFAVTKNRKVTDTGGCPEVYVDSETACMIYCTLHDWCRVYVATCTHPAPNICSCIICQMDPVQDPNTPGDSSVGKALTPIRLINENSCGGGLEWTQVSSACVASAGSISSTFTVSPILSLRIIEMSATIGSTTVKASPVCPPNFTPRGQVTCSDTEGIWHGQNTLACFSLECYQPHGNKQYYAGNKSITKSGRPCWTWQYPGPFTNNYLDDPYPFDFYDIVKAKNYCRVFFTDDDVTLWCYNGNYNSATDSLRWEDCSVPQCRNIY